MVDLIYSRNPYQTLTIQGDDYTTVTLGNNSSFETLLHEAESVNIHEAECVNIINAHIYDLNNLFQDPKNIKQLNITNCTIYSITKLFDFIQKYNIKSTFDNNKIIHEK